MKVLKYENQNENKQKNIYKSKDRFSIVKALFGWEDGKLEDRKYWEDKKYVFFQFSSCVFGREDRTRNKDTK